MFGGFNLSVCGGDRWGRVFRRADREYRYCRFDYPASRLCCW